MRRLLLTLLISSQTACALVYTGASTATLATTGKSIPEHAASVITQSDCSTYNYLFKDKDYLCEQRDIAKTYNRSGI
jgi:hypothetical protein